MDPRLYTIPPWAFFATPIDMMFGETHLATGTSSYVSVNDSHYLVTNLHNITGRSPETGNLLSLSGGVPDRLRGWYLGFTQPTPGEIEYNLDHWVSKTVDLYEADGRPRWLIHPTYSDVDVGCVPFKPAGGVFPALSLDRYAEPADVYPGQGIQVVGYPAGNTSVARTPILTSGTLASPFNLGFQGRPRFLIDCNTMAGNSGSPVLGYSGYISNVNLFDRTFQLPEQRVLGIYSGRLRSLPSDLQAPPMSSVGQVWKLIVVKETIEAGIRAIVG